MDVSSIQKDRGIKKQTNKQNGKQYLHLNYWLQSANKRSNWAYHNHLRSWPCWWAFLHAEKKKRKTRIWWESLFTFMYQQISLRRRRNIIRVSNVWKAAPIRLFRLGPQRTQRNNGKVFGIIPSTWLENRQWLFYHTSHGAQVGKQNRNLCDKDFGAVSQTSFTRVVRRLISANPGRLRVVSLFSRSVEQNARDTQMTTRATESARRERHECSRARALPSLNLEKKRDCSQSITRVSWKIFSIIFRASNHQILHKKDYTKFDF